MKFLKIPLADDNTYTIRTFTMLQQIVMKKEYKKFQSLEEEKDKILFEHESDGKKKKDGTKWILKEILTDKEKKRLEEIDLEGLNFGIDVLRKCLSWKHKEFAKDNDPQKDKEISEKVADLVDTDDIRNIVQFAFNGTYIHTDSVIEVDLNSVQIKPDEGKSGDEKK